jgi:predicted CopG family antitoxin
MASRNINIELSVYERLARLKGENESFSQLLQRLLGASAKGLNESFGALKELDYGQIKRSRRDRDVVL